MFKLKKNKGRDPLFKCSICGKFVSYDRRTININTYINAVFDRYEEQWFPEEVVEITHKKCERKK